MPIFRFLLRTSLSVLPLSIFPAAAVTAAHAQFALTASPLTPSSVDPGGSATSNLTLTVTSIASPVDLTCGVTSNQITSDLPACAISPASESASSVPSLTITTSASTLPGAYQILVTGTSESTVATVTLSFNVADLAQDYTISVFPTTAIPSPVVAGSVATSTVTIAPIGSYTGTINLSCLSVTPVVTGAPVCSFNPSAVKIASGTSQTSTLTLTTFTTVNNPPSSSNKPLRPRIFYATWLLFPALAIAGLGAGKGRKKILWIFLLIVTAGGLFFLPACGGNSNNATNQITPNNTYTFTLTGSDQNGLGPSSTSTATVTLEVTTQK